MNIWQKSLKVGKTDRYSVKLENFAAGQAITGATLTPAGALTTVGGVSIDGDIVSWLITGVTAGVETYDVEYSTATRSSCVKSQLLIEAC